MNAKNNPSSDVPADRQIVITRLVDAPREMVWDAMTNPEHVVKWWGPRGFTTTVQEMDVRPGGVWRLVMHGPDGTDYPNKSTFTEVVRPERIRIFLEGGKKGDLEIRFQMTWTFDEEEEGKTRVTIRQVYDTAEDRERVATKYGAVEGGQQTLARLSEEMAKIPVVIERGFDAPIEAVWKAITDEQEMRKWYFNVDSFKPEIGHKTKFNIHAHGKDFLHLWEVTAVETGRKIAYSWRFDGYPGNSIVTFELFPEGGGTRLRLTHAGLETFDPEVNEALARGNFVKGWTQIIGASLKGFVEKTSTEDGDFIISRIFDAPRELVWQAWTDPRHMARWWGPQGFTNPVCDMDVRVGGAYRIVMRSPDGDEFPLKGAFREIVKPDRLVLFMDCSAHPDWWLDQVIPNRDKSKKPVVELVQTVTFEDCNGKTRLTIHSRFESAAVREAMLKMGMSGGWSSSLERLSALLASL